jgi:hypothetical protein
VFGVAVLASVFASHGSYLSPAAFAEGMRAAIAVGAVAVATATVALIGVPLRRSLTVELHAHTNDAAEFAAAAACGPRGEARRGLLVVPRADSR